MLSENERRHKLQNQPRHPPFCSNAQTPGIWSKCFNWPDIANSLCLCCVSFSHKANERKQKLKHKEMVLFLFWSLCLRMRLCLCLRQPRFHDEISALMFELVLVLASLVKTNQAWASALRSDDGLALETKNRPSCSVCDKSTTELSQITTFNKTIILW